MLEATSVLRSRRRRRGQDSSTRAFGATGAVFLAVVGLVIGAAGAMVAWVYHDLTHDLPDVSEVESLFNSGGAPAFLPIQLYDRTGTVELAEVANPLAQERRWLRLGQAEGEAPSGYVVLASVAALDPTFWTNPGFAWQNLDPRQSGRGSETIAERLAESSLIPLGKDRPGWAGRARRALLAAELTRRYPKSQILEWYLNSAFYGQQAYGIDGAALVYFGKHASALTLAQSAALAALPDWPEKNPIESPQQAAQLRAYVLEVMVQQGVIRTDEAVKAGKEPLVDQRPGAEPSESDMAGPVLDELAAVLGSRALYRSGLRVITTLDRDLQLQASCVVRTHLDRLNGASAGAVEPAADGSVCVAAGLLPPLRPGDTGIDHHVPEARLLLVDPTRGEILSLIGDVVSPRAAGAALMPLIYVTAFSRGYAPGSMVLDVPVAVGEDVPDLVAQVTNPDGRYHGPVRMRTALANGYAVAAARVAELAGPDHVWRTAEQMGVALPILADPERVPALAMGDVAVSLRDLTFAYGVVANRGQMVGRASMENGVDKPVSLVPTIILRVEDHAGRTLYAYAAAERPVLGPQLAYLMVDVMSDEQARWPSLGQPNPLEIGRSAGAIGAATADERDVWTIGFTPSRVLGVWMGSPLGEPMEDVDVLNGTSAVWHALMRYAVREMPIEAWAPPTGVLELDVCDPSGLLPTAYCPRIVRERYISGTEPTSVDNLYQPVRINKETGKLATLFTPLQLVEERVYMIPPPEAMAWAKETQIDQPPIEYDTVSGTSQAVPGVEILSPGMFELVKGKVIIEGKAAIEGFRFYRLQYGQGLDPTQWTQIGSGSEVPVREGELGIWDTSGLTGLHTLQLVVVDEQERVATASVTLTIDNQGPSIVLVSPSAGQLIRRSRTPELALEAEVTDENGPAEVAFFVDGKLVAAIADAPFSARWKLGPWGEHVVFVRARDFAGNTAESERLTFTVAP